MCRRRDVVATLRDSGREIVAALAAIPESRGGFRYAPDKWTIREVVGHLIDAERIFGYRALRLARADATPLPGFEENDYVRTAGSDARTMADLVDELRVVREGTVRLFASLPRRGVDAPRRREPSGGERACPGVHHRRARAASHDCAARALPGRHLIAPGATAETRSSPDRTSSREERRASAVA